MKKLLVIDFDDTLVQTGAKVIVRHGDGSASELTPAEYAVFEPAEDDKFDYSQFDNLVDPRPIKRYNRILHKAIENPKVSKVVILTARGNAKPVAKFISRLGITGGVKIVALNSPDPDKKREYVERQIRKGFDRILFIDDSDKNIKAVGQLRHQYPNVRLMTHVPKESDVEKEKHKPPYRISKWGDLLQKRIKNPVTGNDILVKTALGYDPSAPARKVAMQLLKRNIQR